MVHFSLWLDHKYTSVKKENVIQYFFPKKNCLSSGRRTQPRIQHNDLRRRKFIDSALTHQMRLNERPFNGISRNRSNDSRICDFSRDSQVILGRIHLSIIPPHLLSSGQKLWKSIWFQTLSCACAMIDMVPCAVVGFCRGRCWYSAYPLE